MSHVEPERGGRRGCPDCGEENGHAIGCSQQITRNKSATTDYRAFLADRRENLRKLYARLRVYGHKLRQKGLISWSDKSHSYYAEFINDRRPKERDTIQKLLALQKNVGEQAMLLLELEHALDCEEAKNMREKP